MADSLNKLYTEPFDGVLGKVIDGVSFGGVREAVDDEGKTGMIFPVAVNSNYYVNFAVNYTVPNYFVNLAVNSIDSLLVS